MLYKTPNIEKKPSSLRYYQEGPPSNVKIDSWTLDITKDFTNSSKTSFSYADILQLPQITEVRRMVCVCNWSIRRSWSGIPLETLLKEAHIEVSEHLYLKQISIGTPGKGTYESTIPLFDACKRRAMLIHSVDGQQLSLEQGYPLRLLDFGLYGYKGVKGLKQIIITEKFEAGYWEDEAGYDKTGVIKPKKYWCVDLREHKFIRGDGEVTEF